jgi:hypothetical protein
MGAWSPGQSLELHGAMLRYDPDRYIKPSGVIALLASIAVLFVDARASTVSLALDGAGVAGFVGVIVISEAWNVPVNRQVAAWPQISSVEYAPLLARWLRAHGWRTWTGVLALLLLSISLALR